MGSKETSSINCSNTGINYIPIVWQANIILALPRLQKLSFPTRKFWPTSFYHFISNNNNNNNNNNEEKTKNKKIKKTLYVSAQANIPTIYVIVCTVDTVPLPCSCIYDTNPSPKKTYFQKCVLFPCLMYGTSSQIASLSLLHVSAISNADAKLFPLFVTHKAVCVYSHLDVSEAQCLRWLAPIW